MLTAPRCLDINRVQSEKCATIFKMLSTKHNQPISKRMKSEEILSWFFYVCSNSEVRAQSDRSVARIGKIVRKKILQRIANQFERKKR